jgi:hypothetical protein
MHPAFPWFEPPASGPGPVTNRSRWPQRPGDDSGSVALPPLPAGVEGVSDYDQLVGDNTNPILQPWAAEVVKKFGDMSVAGIVYGNPSNQCWPMPMPKLNSECASPLKRDKVNVLNDFDALTATMHNRHHATTQADAVRCHAARCEDAACAQRCAQPRKKSVEASDQKTCKLKVQE